MHYEILVEDKSGEIMLNALMEKLKESGDTYRVHPYNGCGKIPKDLDKNPDPTLHFLLDQLPATLRAFGKTYSFNESSITVLIVCDLDRRNRDDFIAELSDVLNHCNPKPNAKFCLAIEEGEAWLLGDLNAVRAAYPKAKLNVLHKYKNDSICGTWELLADAIYPGGVKALISTGSYSTIGKIKCEWATKITPLMNVNANSSLSFNKFKETIDKLSSTKMSK